MLNFNKPVLALVFFLVSINLIGSESKTSIPGEVFAYLKTKEVPKDLKQKLDKIFHSEKVIEGLSIIYNNPKELSQEGLKMLANEGFKFFQDQQRVFMHKSIPEFVFKIGGVSDLPYLGADLRSELKNAERIRFAELLNDLGKGLIKTPKKYAYMPYVYRTEYICLPICIVVAEFINPMCQATNVNELECWKILLSMGYGDLHPSNVFQFPTYCVLIDTEPHGKKLEYPKLQLRAKL
ncbi:MAG: hypothetical protein P4L22_04925 [Candidatus Babeliales bacterium]|nr:hypothetical protein [Candidatus Babeliales bacterium]